jgi:hypothetical protein
MILQDNRAHASNLCELCNVNRVDRTGTIIGVAMNVDIDRAGQQSRHFCFIIPTLAGSKDYGAE